MPRKFDLQSDIAAKSDEMQALLSKAETENRKTLNEVKKTSKMPRRDYRNQPPTKERRESNWKNPRPQWLTNRLRVQIRLT